MKRTKRIIACAMACLLALSLLAACGAQPSSQSPAAMEPGTAASGVEPGLLRAAVLCDITTMDVSETTNDYLIPLNVFDRLFETRPASGASEIVKSLAEDYSVSEDGLTYAFTLREGVVFSNGSALTASDVQFSFERLLKKAKENTEIALEILGAEAVMNGETDVLEGFTVTDDTHFTVTLSAPNAGFLAELSSPAMSIVDAESMTAGFGKEPAETIGSGPFVVTEWVSNDHYTLVYNDKYWGAEPSVKKLIVKVIPDATSQNLMFQNGELDILDLVNLDSAIVASTYKADPSAHIVSTPKVGLTYLIMNENNPYLADVKVRKAIAMAIDADEIIQGIFMGDAQRENGVIPTGIWAHNDAFEGFSYDPDAAKALLAEAGYKEGEIRFELSMDSGTNTSNQLIYAFISDSLKKIGIEATVVSYDHSAWLAKRSSGEMDSFVANWGMDYNDPANIMYIFFGSAENAKGRSLNYHDAEIMGRVSAARAIVDDAERLAEYQALEKKLIEEDAAWVPFCVQLHLWCLGERVADFTPHWAGFTDFYVADVVLK